MRLISINRIKNAISNLCIQSNLVLRKDCLVALNKACIKETDKRAKEILNAIIKNALIAKKEGLAICQDTGLACIFVEIGQDVRIDGDLKSAINKGIDSGYRKGYLRNSIIREPILRGRPKYSPAIIHTDIVKGNKLKLTILPKGFGCENKSQLKMFNPTVKISEIKKFIIDVVKSAGPDACPPFIVGVGIGGTADYAMYLAKKALLKKITDHAYKLASDLFKEINKLNIGPMGLGGKTTALGVNILTYPTHIAGLPVAVNISCHALRSATKII
jgi:fumarate hydratase subunit alpha